MLISIKENFRCCVYCKLKVVWEVFDVFYDFSQRLVAVQEPMLTTVFTVPESD